MKRSVYSILLLSIFLLFYGQKTLLLFWYHLEPDSFVEMFCENLDVPAPVLECQGKCQLAGLAQQEPFNSPESGDQASVLLEANFTAILNTYSLHLAHIFDMHKSTVFFTLPAYALLYMPDVFHPPAISY